MLRIRLQILLLAALIILTGYVIPAQAGTRSPVSVKATYLYDLATFTGNVPYSWPRVEPDSAGKEIYVINQNLVQIFDTNGMEVFRFGDSLDLGSITDLTIDLEGNILLLSHRWSDAKLRVDYEITRCNYRGEPISRFVLQNLPPKYSEFVPNRMVLQGGKLYFASLSTMTVVVTDVQGLFQGGYEILPLLELHEKDREGAMMDGFSVDREGNIFFSVPPIFRVYKFTPGGQISYFGKPGGAPGSFNIVAGVVSDAKGNILVVDRLKGAVLIFDKGFNFIGQFSSPGYKSGFLIVPNDVVIDSQDRVYITQAARRGVSVFKLSYN
jgi:hypothetical protein